MADPSGRLSRRGALGLVGAALLSGCTRETRSAQPPAGGSTPTRHAYGEHPEQFGDLYLPRGPRRRGTVVVIHGGFWQASYDLSLGAPLSADLADRGWAAWNLEYRRLGNGGGWPATFEDVAAGVDQLAALPGVDPERVVTLGHSAGGHLAAWVAARGTGRTGDLGGPPRVRVAGVVSQAGVLDLAGAAGSGLGGSSVTDLLGGRPAEVPDRYAKGDPLQQVPLPVPVRCVHGRDDNTVPLRQSRAYVDASTAAGGDAELVVVDGDHFALIDPASSAWERTADLLPALVGPDESAG